MTNIQRLQSDVRTRTFLVLLTLAAAACRPAALRAQAGSDLHEPTPRRFWVAGGLGGGGNPDVGGLAFMLELAGVQEPHRVGLRVLGLAEPFQASRAAATDMALLYGRARVGDVGHVALSTGLASVWVDWSGERGDETGIGVPLVLDAALNVLPVAGIGGQLFATVSNVTSYAGLVVYVNLGWLPRGF